MIFDIILNNKLYQKLSIIKINSLLENVNCK